MKTKHFVLLFSAICIKQLSAQSLRYSHAQPFIGLSAYSTEQSDPLSFSGNQAALARLRSPGIGVFAEKRFMLSETSVYTLGASLSTPLGNIGILLNHTGFANFNENKIGLAYARKLGRFADVGVQFNYYGYKIPAYVKAATINFEVGILLHLTNNFHAGIHVYNPAGAKIGKAKKEKLASVYKLGLGYDASDKFFIGSEIIKEEDKKINVTAGFQYRFAKQFFLKMGIISESTTGYAGAGIAWKSWRLDISAGYHQQLGFSPGLLLIMNFKSGR